MSETISEIKDSMIKDGSELYSKKGSSRRETGNSGISTFSDNNSDMKALNTGNRQNVAGKVSQS